MYVYKISHFNASTKITLEKQNVYKNVSDKRYMVLREI